MPRSILIILGAALLAGLALAQEHSRGERFPPEQALEACASASANDPCSFVGRRGESVEGICYAPEDKPLACKPEDRPPESLRESE